MKPKHHRPKIWRTADGRDYQIRQMETEHIRNALRVIKRRNDWGPPWRLEFVEPLFHELERRDDESSKA